MASSPCQRANAQSIIMHHAFRCKTQQYLYNMEFNLQHKVDLPGHSELMHIQSYCADEEMKKTFGCIECLFGTG